MRVHTCAKAAHNPLSIVVIIFGDGRKILTIAPFQNGKNSIIRSPDLEYDLDQHRN